MPRFAANLSMLFTEQDFLDRFEAAAKAGFSGVEYLFPYDYAADEIKARLEANDLTQVLFNLPAGDWAGGERGIAILPERVEEFRAGTMTDTDGACRGRSPRRSAGKRSVLWSATRRRTESAARMRIW